MSLFTSDVRHLLRMAVKSPFFFAVLLLTLALGIGASSAIFTLVSGLLRPLPFADSERLVMVWEGQAQEGYEKLHVAPPNFEDWVEQNEVFDDVAALYPGTFNLTGDGVAERLLGAEVTSSFFRTLGVPITVGRDFAADEDGDGAPRVVLVSHRLWQGRYGGSPELLGESIRIDGTPHTVVGIVPPGLGLPRQAKLWIPLRVEEDLRRRDAHFLEVLARLKAGVTVPAAQLGMEAVAEGLAAEYPKTNSGWTVTVVPLLEELVGDVRPAFWVLSGAVALLLLITCVNVASLLLARALQRTPEMALRQAFGASRPQVLRQLLSESLVLGLIASGLGVAVAWGLLRVFDPLLPGELRALGPVSLDGRTLGFAVLLGLVTTLLVSLVPALRAAGGDLAGPLKKGAKWAAGGNLTLRSALVVGEFALTFALLLTSTLLGRSFLHLALVDPGFEPEHVLTARVGLDSAKYDNPVKVNNFFDDLMLRISGLPGVLSVATVEPLPLTGSTEGTVFLPEGWPRPQSGEEPTTRLSVVSEGYFQTLGIPLLQGRDFSYGDLAIGEDCNCIMPGITPLVIVNETMARKYWPGESPVGKRMQFGDLDSGTMFEIIGLASDVRYEGLEADVMPRSYLFDGQFQIPAMSFAIRTSGDPAALAGAVRRDLYEMDPDLPAYSVGPLAGLLEDALARPRLIVTLMGAFATMALILAAVGLYGVMATSVGQRAKELGIHIALGSNQRSLFWMVLRRALVLALLGALAGAALALASGKAVASLLFGVGSSDPITFVVAGCVLAGITLLGAVLPAWRAMRLDPMVALRHE